MAERFEELDAWKTARQLTNLIYDLTSKGEYGRDWGLVDQSRRASVGVMNNIAEGFESRTRVLFIEYLGRARGSCGEVRSILYVALDREYVTRAEFEAAYDLADKASRQVSNLGTYLQTHPKPRRKGSDVDGK
jgi:four helix bundle protein